MSGVTLDRNRPFGQVCGGAEAWRYEQDGKRFDAEGLEVVGPGLESSGGVDEGGAQKVKRRSR